MTSLLSFHEVDQQRKVKLLIFRRSFLFPISSARSTSLWKVVLPPAADSTECIFAWNRRPSPPFGINPLCTDGSCGLWHRRPSARSVCRRLFAISDDSHSRSIPVIGTFLHTEMDKEKVENRADDCSHPWHEMFCQKVKMNDLQIIDSTSHSAYGTLAPERGLDEKDIVLRYYSFYNCK
jgi:hypothetical protein